MYCNVVFNSVIFQPKLTYNFVYKNYIYFCCPFELHNKRKKCATISQERNIIVQPKYLFDSSFCIQFLSIETIDKNPQKREGIASGYVTSHLKCKARSGFSNRIVPSIECCIRSSQVMSAFVVIINRLKSYIHILVSLQYININ